MVKTNNDLGIALISFYDLSFGIRQISSVLKQKGYRPRIYFFQKKRFSSEFLDGNYFRRHVYFGPLCIEKDISLLIGALREQKPVIVLISVSSVTMQLARTITRKIKEKIDTFVIWGGVHAIIAPDECIQYADAVCVGEGEYAILEAVQRFSEGKTIDSIRNLWIRRDNSIQKNDMRPLIEDLDSLPFPDFIDRDNKILIDSGRSISDPPIVTSSRGFVYPIMTSRGCPYNCSFCCSGIFRERFYGLGTYLRRRSVKHVIAELRIAVQKRSFDAISFWDDVFTHDPNWIDEFCLLYRQEIAKPFICYAHPNTIQKETIRKLRSTGLVSLVMGIQSGNEKIAGKLFARVQQNRQIVEFSRFAQELGIIMHYDMIADNPYDTAKSQKSTVELLLQLPQPYRIQFYSLCWFPETQLTQKALADKIISEKDLEQNSAKALSNFEMFIPLSPSKEHYFWNCIKHMAVRRDMSKNFVQACMRSRFFRKYPKVLFDSLRLFIFIRNYYQYVREKHSIPAYQGVWWKKFMRDVEYAVFVKNLSEVKQEFIVRIVKGLKYKNDFTIYVVLRVWKAGEIGYRSDSVKSRTQIRPVIQMWETIIPSGQINTSNIKITLMYPTLHCSTSEETINSRSFYKQEPLSLDSGLYSLEVCGDRKLKNIFGSIVFSV